MTTWSITDLKFGLVILNASLIVAALLFTSKIEMSSNSKLIGRVSLGASEGENILPPEVSSIIVEPDSATIPKTIANAAIIPPKIILRFNE